MINTRIGCQFIIRINKEFTNLSCRYHRQRSLGKSVHYSGCPAKWWGRTSVSAASVYHRKTLHWCECRLETGEVHWQWGSFHTISQVLHWKVTQRLNSAILCIWHKNAFPNEIIFIKQNIWAASNLRFYVFFDGFFLNHNSLISYIIACQAVKWKKKKKDSWK